MVMVRFDKEDKLVVVPGNRMAFRETVLVVLEKMLMVKLLMDVEKPIVKSVKSAVALATCRIELVELRPSMETPSLMVRPVVIAMVPALTKIQSPAKEAVLAAAKVANGKSKRCL